MRVADALRDAAARLEAVSDTARLDAELLMAEALGATRSDMLLRGIDEAMPAAFEALILRRLAQEPVAQILGRKEFYGREFRVGPAVLTPRADSETLIEAALEFAPPERILDLGTGSGALLLTLLAERPGAEGIGIDASPGALGIAQANAEAIGVSASMLLRDWTKPGWADDLGRFNLIVANPPYVEDGADLAPSVRDYEPAAALFAGPEGLDDYRVLLPQLPALLEPEGVAIVEIGASQAEAVAAIAASAGFAAELRRDLANRPRALILRIRLGKEPASG